VTEGTSSAQTETLGSETKATSNKMLLLLVMMMMVHVIIVVGPQTAVKKQLADASVAAITVAIIMVAVMIVIMILEIEIITGAGKVELAEIKEGNTQQTTYLYDV
jgi:hypothetical protein